MKSRTKEYRVDIEFIRESFNGHDYKDSFSFKCKVMNEASATRKAERELNKFCQAGPVVRINVTLLKE